MNYFQYWKMKKEWLHRNVCSFDFNNENSSKFKGKPPSKLRLTLKGPDPLRALLIMDLKITHA